jgi:hypothetical protein
MSSTTFFASAWLADAFWIVPVIGGAACALAYLLGRRFLVARAGTPSETDSAGDAAHFLQGVTRDRRCAPRRRGNIVEVELSESPNAPSVRGWVMDRSIGGLCLLMDQPIDTGIVLLVRPRNAAASVPWTEVTICSCREDAGQYEVGCQFHHTPNWSLLLMFG